VRCAESAIDIWNRQYPQDSRPTEALDAAKRCITEATTNAAWAAVRAVGDAGAAGAAAWAAARAAGAEQVEYAIKILGL